MGKWSEYVKSYGLVTKEIASSGAFWGQHDASGAYPYAVSRNEAEVRRLGEQKFQAWEGTFEGYDAQIYKLEDLKRIWNSQRTEAMRLFASAYAGAYLERVAESDRETGRAQPQPQPVQRQATPSNTATLEGAKITLKRVERKSNEYVYHLELIDPNNFDGTERTEWVVYFEGATVPETTTNTATAAYGQASYYIPEPTSRSSQTPRKPLGSYLRKPK